ncbi:hypothetical protein ElyMa_006699300 [Elysia marginata]|uniref:Uncharacterized protein n=1 Tax=Elysia marginata TaxID=1093978 RepID=A0AAV4ITZ1_9GAST|nr:hypothetical protein ElyMa_006699300 [Elysia marginata]
MCRTSGESRDQNGSKISKTFQQKLSTPESHFTKVIREVEEFDEIKSIQSKFWRDVMTNWLERVKVVKDDEDMENRHTTEKQPFFNNHYIRHKNKPMWSNKWFKAGLRAVCREDVTRFASCDGGSTNVARSRGDYSHLLAVRSGVDLEDHLD